MLAPSIDVEILDPMGNVVSSGDPDYSQIVSDFRRWQQVSDETGLEAGQWSIRVSGDGAYSLRVLAESSIHLAYQGDFTPRSGEATRMRAFLDVPGQPPTVSWSLMSMDGTATQPIELFDDGMHGDGNANDGYYGGMVVPVGSNCWFLVAEGVASNGDSFRRQYHAPLRLRGYSLMGPDSSVSLPGSTQTVNFMLANNATEGGDPVTYDLGLYSEQGWAITSTLPVSITLNAGEIYDVDVELSIPMSATIGVLEEISLVAAPMGDIALSAIVVAEIEVVAELQNYLPIITRP